VGNVSAYFSVAESSLLRSVTGAYPALVAPDICKLAHELYGWRTAWHPVEDISSQRDYFLPGKQTTSARAVLSALSARTGLWEGHQVHTSSGETHLPGFLNPTLL